jgi:hypothetical protein
VILRKRIRKELPGQKALQQHSKTRSIYIQFPAFFEPENAPESPGFKILPDQILN